MSPPLLPLLAAAGAAAARCNFSAAVTRHGRRPAPAEEYTLFSPEFSAQYRGRTYLMSRGGEVVHYWDSPLAVGYHVSLLPGGSLLRLAFTGKGAPSCAGGAASPKGVIERVGWAGNREWEFTWSATGGCMHHDLAPLPNGNVLVTVYDVLTAEEAARLGYRGGNGLMPDAVYEVRPTGAVGGELVWEWHMKDHLVQDTDPALPGYGEPGAHPELLDVNVGVAGGGAAGPVRGAGGANASTPSILNHCNGIDYNAELDQIVLSFRMQSEVVVIDHSTTAAEARTGTGGRSGRGGRLLWRWGNPANYARGGVADRALDGQHNPHWVANDVSSAPPRRMLVFNNGWQASGGASAVVEVETPPPDPATGRYPLDHTTSTGAAAYGPARPAWEYSDGARFFSPIFSSAQRLSDARTFVNEGEQCRLFEVAPRRGGGEVVWQFDAAAAGKGRCFRVPRYAAGGAALAGRDLAAPVPAPC